jgi:MFS family permease
MVNGRATATNPVGDARRARPGRGRDSVASSAMTTTDAGQGERPARPARPGLRDALVAFRYRNFTLFWVGALLSNSGTWVQNVTIPFVIFQITGSPLWVGVTSFLQFLPVVVMSPLGGSIADRFDRKAVLIVTQSAQLVVALLLWAAWVTDHRSIGVIIVLVGASGLITGINIPSWQAFVSQLVPREVLLNAVTLNSTQFNASRFFGPAIGGLVLAYLGVAWAFLINAISFMAVIAALLLIQLPRFVAQRAGRRPAVLAQFRDSIRYSRARPGILACFIAVVALGALGSPMVQLFIVFARDVFHVDDVSYGMLGAALGLGSILAAPFVAGPGSGWRRSRLVEVAMLAYGLAVVCFGLAPVFGVAVVALLVAGAGYLALASTLNTTIQLQVDEAMRGKVLAVYVLLLTAALPIGSLIQGGIAQVAGPRFAVTSFGILFLAVTAWLRFGSGLLVSVDDERDARDE